MGKFKLSISMSLDGYVAGADQEREESTRDRRRAASRLGGSAQGIPREQRTGRRRGQREHADCRGDPRQRGRDHHGPKHARWRASRLWATTPGRAGGETTRPSTTRSSFSPTTRANRWRCRAEPLSTSSRMESSRLSSRPGSRWRQGRASRRRCRAPHSSTWRRVCWTRSSSRSSLCCSEAAHGRQHARRQAQARASRGDRCPESRTSDTCACRPTEVG